MLTLKCWFSAVSTATKASKRAFFSISQTADAEHKQTVLARRNLLFFRRGQKCRRAAACRSYTESHPIEVNLREQNHAYLVAWTRGFEDLDRGASATDRAEIKYTIPTSLALVVFQSWAESVPISRSYDQTIFSSSKWLKNFENFDLSFFACMNEFSDSLFTEI